MSGIKVSSSSKLVRKAWMVSITALLIASCILATLFAVSYRSVRTQMRDNVLQLLDYRVRLFGESFITIIERCIDGFELLVSIDADIADETIYRDKLMYLVRNTTGCMDASIQTARRTMVFRNTLSHTLLFQDPLQRTNTPVIPQGIDSRLNTTWNARITSIQPTMPTFDMTMCIDVDILQGSTLVGRIQLLFNTTEMMTALNIDNSLQIGSLHYPIEFSLSTLDGILIESSRNRFGTAFSGFHKNGTRIPVKQSFPARSEHVAVADYDWALAFHADIPGTVVTDIARETASMMVTIGSIVFVILMLLSVMLTRQVIAMLVLRKQEIVSRYHALQLKMDPHFLFNTINHMVSFVETGRKAQTLELLRSLSVMLHAMIRDPAEIVSLEKELVYLHKYVELQDLLHPSSFSIDWDIDPAVMEERVPKLCLQPLVENSIIHASRQNPTGILQIRIHAHINQGVLIISIADNGQTLSSEESEVVRQRLESLSPELEDSGRIGLASTQKRLKILYGPHYGLRIGDQEQGFRIEIIIPAGQDLPEHLSALV
jgi:hypothetical protein